MRLQDFMDQNNYRDGRFAPLVGADRSHISKIRRGKLRPSWKLAAAIKAFTNGQVTADDFLEAEAAE